MLSLPKLQLAKRGTSAQCVPFCPREAGHRHGLGTVLSRLCCRRCWGCGAQPCCCLSFPNPFCRSRSRARCPSSHSLECAPYIDGEFTEVLNICWSWQACNFFLNKEIKARLSQVVKIVTTTRESAADFWMVSSVKFLLSCCKSYNNFMCCSFCLFFYEEIHSWNYNQIFVASMRWQCVCNISLSQLPTQDLL